MYAVNIVHEEFTKEELASMANWFEVYVAAENIPSSTHQSAIHKINHLLDSNVVSKEDEQKMIETVEYLTKHIGYATPKSVISSYSKFYGYDPVFASTLLYKMIKEQKSLARTSSFFYDEAGNKKLYKKVVTMKQKEEIAKRKKLRIDNELRERVQTYGGTPNDAVQLLKLLDELAK